MNIFGMGPAELAVIGIVALLIFGPKKLPEIGRSFAKTLRSFQDASREFQDEFKREAEQIEKSVAEPMRATLEDKPALEGKGDRPPASAPAESSAASNDANDANANAAETAEAESKDSSPA